MLTYTLTLRICPHPSIHVNLYAFLGISDFYSSTYPSIHFIRLSLHLSSYPSIYHPSFSQSIMLSTNLFVYPSNCPFICPCVCPCVCPYLHLSIHTSILPSIYPSIHPFIHPSIYPVRNALLRFLSII